MDQQDGRFGDIIFFVLEFLKKCTITRQNVNVIWLCKKVKQKVKFENFY